MPEIEQDNPPKKPTRRYRIAGWGLICLILLLGWMWQRQRLSEEERKIIGHWTNESEFDTGHRSISVWHFRSDRSMVLHDTLVFPETEDEESKTKVTKEEAIWQIKNGKIVITPDRSTKKHLRLSFLKLVDTVSGRKFIDGELGIARVKFPESDKMTIEWYDPMTQKYHDETKQMRRNWTRGE